MKVSVNSSGPNFCLRKKIYLLKKWFPKLRLTLELTTNLGAHLINVLISLKVFISTLICVVNCEHSGRSLI